MTVNQLARRLVEVRDDKDGGQRMSRKGLMSKYTCRLCGIMGHNKRRCPQNSEGANTPKEPAVRKKRNHDEEQPKCTLCHQPGHNRATCTSAVANMYQERGASDAGASSSAPRKKRVTSSTANPKNKAASSSVPPNNEPASASDPPTKEAP